MTERLRLLILVKTQPTFSNKYLETVCTAGITENGDWRRIYPIPFRFLEGEEQYQKYQWIECDVELNPRDSRPESRKLSGISGRIITGDKISTKDSWSARRHVIEKSLFYTNKRLMLSGSQNNTLSLCTFKPTQIDGFDFEPCEREYTKEEDAAWRVYYQQEKLGLFENEKKELPRQKMPYKFYYKFTDDDGVPSRLQILDWELASLYWRYSKNEEEALEKVRKKYGEEFLSADKELHFFMGTRLGDQMKKSPNPWSIIGVAPFPARGQRLLNL